MILRECFVVSKCKTRRVRYRIVDSVFLCSSIKKSPTRVMFLKCNSR